MNSLRGIRTIAFLQLFVVFLFIPLRPARAQDSIGQKQSKTPARRVVCKNKKYRLKITLPASWKGFSVLIEEWAGSVMSDDWEMVREEKGPRIIIRHPLWTEENRRQDIPIMIFTRDQWKIVEEEKIILSAAPIGPSQIGRNKKYVFALPARYNYAFTEGWEEVEKLLAEHAVQPY